MDAQIKAKTSARIAKPGSELVKPGELGIILELTVKDKDGKVTDQRVMKAKSFVRQFLELLYVQMQQYYWGGSSQPYRETVLYMTDKNGYRRPVVACYSYQDGIFNCDGGVGDTNIGIMVGTGTTPPNIEDHALQVQCGHGSGAGQFSHGAVTFGLPTSDATTSHFTVTRDFSNNSGALITVNEVGLYVAALAINYNGYVEDAYFLVIRDVISGGVDVPSGQTLTVNYREQAAV